LDKRKRESFYANIFLRFAVEKITFAENCSLIYWGRLDLTVGDNVVSACQVVNVHL
jgi:hypothetical protein